MNWREAIQNRLRKHGYELVRYPISQLLRHLEVDTVLDVGANCGQFGEHLRSLGYQKRIVSFEPMHAAFLELQTRAKSDPHWTAINTALGSDMREASLHIAANSASSSLLERSERLAEVDAPTAFVGEETVSVQRLDAVFHDLCSPSETVFLKIDAQGYEHEVLKGAEAVLPRIAGLQLELSLVPLYEGETPAEVLISYLRDNGFVPYWIIHGFKDVSTQQLLQIDGLFVRDK